MGDYMSKLHPDILCHIFSSLTVKDAFRVKSLSPSWKDLPDTRSLLQFDANTIIREKADLRSEFVKAVNQFFKIWRPQKASALKIKYGLGAEFASDINRWVAIAIGQKIEELNLDFKSQACVVRPYVLPFHLLDIHKGTYLKHLRLRCCRLMTTDESTSWLSKLHTLELVDTRLDFCDFECIVSSAPNLESLRVDAVFKDSTSLHVHHQSLKKLWILGTCKDIELNCPVLEIFEFTGHSYGFSFSKVPLLKEVSLKLCFRVKGCSEDFRDLARDAPLLQTLSLWVTTEVVALPPTTTMSCLKRLDLLLRKALQEFDLLTITHMLHASPVLEELKLTVDRKVRRRQWDNSWAFLHDDRQHFHLKEVKFEGLPVDEDHPVKLIEYLLRNSVSLQQMVFITEAIDVPLRTNYLNGVRTIWELQAFNPTVEFIVQPV